MAYQIIKLGALLEMENGENCFPSMVAKFSCPLDQDIEDFLKIKAVPFEKQDISKTSLIYADYRGQPILVGYYALAVKEWVIRKGVSKSVKKEITGYRDKDSSPIYLIGQLSKNYYDGINEQHLIAGDTLLGFAFKDLKEASALVGGVRAVMVECQNNPKLCSFYEAYGFKRCGGDPTANGLLQYIRRMNDIEIK